MSSIYVAENILKHIRQRIEVLRSQITEGSVPDYTAYMKLRAQLEAWSEVEDKVRSLLKMEDIDE